MASDVLQVQLRKISTELSEISDPREYGQKLRYRLIDFIEETPVLNKEFQRRAHFYEELPTTLAFQAHLNSIHNAFKILHKAIDPQKLSEKPEYDKLSQKKFHAMLASRKSWPHFEIENKTNGVYVSHSTTPPWDNVLKQYEIIRAFLMDVEQTEALLPDKATATVSLRVTADIERLRDMVAAPKERWYLAEFQKVEFDGRTMGFITDVDSIHKSQAAVQCVCEELILYLQKEQEGKREGRKHTKVIRSIVRGIVTTVKGEEYSFKKKISNSALLCEKVYAYCQQVGDKVSIEKVFPDVWTQPFASDLVANRKKVYFACKSVNDWAKGKGLPRLLEYEKTEIIRCS